MSEHKSNWRPAIVTDPLPVHRDTHGRRYDVPLANLIAIAGVTLMVCAPAIVIIFWRWALR